MRGWGLGIVQLIVIGLVLWFLGAVVVQSHFFDDPPKTHCWTEVSQDTNGDWTC